jgi:hypothetical protein
MKGCKRLNAFLENALMLQGISTQVTDNAFVIVFFVRCGVAVERRAPAG